MMGDNKKTDPVPILALAFSLLAILLVMIGFWFVDQIYQTDVQDGEWKCSEFEKTTSLIDGHSYYIEVGGDVNTVWCVFQEGYCYYSEEATLYPVDDNWGYRVELHEDVVCKPGSWVWTKKELV